LLSVSRALGGRGIGLGGSLGWPVVLIVLGAVLLMDRYVLDWLGRLVCASL